MGDVVQPDRAISLDVFSELMVDLEVEWSESSPEEKFKYALEGAFYLIAFTGGLQGEEVPMVDLFGVNKYWEAGRQSDKPHIVVALLGRFKGETGE